MSLIFLNRVEMKWLNCPHNKGSVSPGSGFLSVSVIGAFKPPSQQRLVADFFSRMPFIMHGCTMKSAGQFVQSVILCHKLTGNMLN
jgi:hypothetical protein